MFFSKKQAGASQKQNLPDCSFPDEVTRPLSIDTRTVWAINRFWMEMENLKTRRYGGKSHHHWYFFMILIKLFCGLLRICGLYERGKRNAEDIIFSETSLEFPNLPRSFDGFKILHLSDLHFGSLENIEGKVVQLMEGKSVDLVLLTGDYRTSVHGPIAYPLRALGFLVDNISSGQGFIGVLGNHDGCHMVDPMEKLGIRMLVNEEVLIHHGDESIQIIGTDDVHYYYSDQAVHALENTWQGFTIAMVHSPEIYDIAAEQGVNLYLSGHTHAGQICLPGGIPLVKHLNRGRKFYKGHWSASLI